MWRHHVGFVSLVVTIASAVSAPPLFGQAAPFRDWQTSSLPDATHAKPRQTCAELASLTGYELTVITTTVVAASAETPEYCRVIGQIQPEVRFEVSLPAIWNGHLYMFGNGGYAGESLDAPARVVFARRALARGFAVTQTNTGHDAAVEPLGSFAVNSQKFLDYAYRAVHVTAMTAKKILQTYYGSGALHSYFDGCSTGGRQGLMSAQRFPDDFDGIVVGAPVLNFTATMIGYNAYQRAMHGAAVSSAHLMLAANAASAKCDAADGVVDGVIDDPRSCRFDVITDVPRCSTEAGGDDCFTAAQARAIAAIHQPVTRGASEVMPAWPVGVTGWVPWFVAPPSGRPIQVNFGETFFRYMAFGKSDPAYDWLAFNLDTDFDKLAFSRTVLDATNPDLSRFKARGGKILSYYGWADPALNPMMGVKYYEAVTSTIGSSTPDFYRLFMVPGMAHCGGGIGVNSFDAFTPLVEWVEKGRAPQSIIGSRIVDGKTVRTRPLCSYPQVAKYKGSGSTDDALNFVCAAP
jgi:feruloyl esterase